MLPPNGDRLSRIEPRLLFDKSLTLRRVKFLNNTYLF